MEDNKGNISKDLTSGTVSKQLLKFAFPFMMANLLQALYSVADMFFVGIYVGRDGIAGVNIGGQVVMLITNIVTGLAIGGTILIAQYTGAKNKEGQSKTIGTLLSVFGIIGVVATIGSLLLSKNLLTILNTPASAMAEAESYLTICCSGYLFIFGYNAIGAILRGLGDSKRPFYFIAIAAITNIILDYLLVGVFGMRAAGAAYATIFSQSLSFVISLIYLYRQDNFAFDFKLQSFRIHKEQLMKMLKIGLPSAVQMSVVSFSFLFVSSLVNGFGVTASAASGIGGKIDTFATLPGQAVSSAVSSMVGQNMGAGKPDRARQTVLAGMKIALSISLGVFVIVQIFPEALVSIFDTDPEVIKNGVMYLRICSINYLLVSLVFCLNALAIGVGFTVFALFNATLNSLLLRVPLCYILSGMFGLKGVYLGQAFASIGAIISGTIYFRSGKWKTRKVLDEAPADVA